MSRITIVLSDSQILFREGIHFVLSGEEDFEVVGEAVDDNHTLSLIEANLPDLAVLSMGRGDFDGVDMTCRIKRHFPSVAVILADEGSSEEGLFEAIKSGANACMSRDATPDELLRLVRIVSTRAYPIAAKLLMPDIAYLTIKEFEALAEANEGLARLLAPLTPQETEILQKSLQPNPAQQSDGLVTEAVARGLENIRHKLVHNQQHYEILKYAQAQLAILAEPPSKRVREVPKEKKDRVGLTTPDAKEKKGSSDNHSLLV